MAEAAVAFDSPCPSRGNLCRSTSGSCRPSTTVLFNYNHNRLPILSWLTFVMAPAKRKNKAKGKGKSKPEPAQKPAPTRKGKASPSTSTSKSDTKDVEGVYHSYQILMLRFRAVYILLLCTLTAH